MDAGILYDEGRIVNNQYRSDIAKVKGLGSAKSGTKHYIMQRITALALLPLAMWFVVSFIVLLQTPVYLVPAFVSSMTNVIALTLFILLLLYHGALGMRVVIEDYIHSIPIKYGLLMALYSLCVISMVAAIWAIFSYRIIMGSN
jgi:succinate dehydrogenase / fumarate reductase membrane anchor subunit